MTEKSPRGWGHWKVILTKNLRVGQENWRELSMNPQDRILKYTVVPRGVGSLKCPTAVNYLEMLDVIE